MTGHISRHSLTDRGGDSPPYRSGNVRLRVSCQHERHQRYILLDVNMPSQPWVY